MRGVPMPPTPSFLGFREAQIGGRKSLALNEVQCFDFVLSLGILITEMRLFVIKSDWRAFELTISVWKSHGNYSEFI